MTDMYVCLCNAVKKSHIESAINSGIATFEELQEHLEVAMNCGACTFDVKKVITQYKGDDDGTKTKSEG
jgi:bacterioferritin-associated ferredoxin